MRDSSRETSLVAERHDQIAPPTCEARNWPACNEALKRQTPGFVESLLRLLSLNRAVPDFSTLSRPTGRQANPQDAGERGYGNLAFTYADLVAA
ncbi:hypothetical protein [Puniceibacterium sediminis]|uniref:hypothetical protein n=1 Tax=Puniceibacterium sediminis TaxID=1608407 RepID=UPI001FE8AAED|nr:hypothetical protein [Puniceibacterium sediminis]